MGGLGIGLGVGKGGGRVGKAVVPYEDTLINVYGASEVWPLVDIASGTTITAKVSSNRNGTLTGWDLQNSAGPVSGKLAPYSDGVNDKGNILTSGLNSIFDGEVGWMAICLKAESAAVWTDGASRGAFHVLADGNNYIKIYKPEAVSRLQLICRFGGAGASQQVFDIAHDWIQCVITWNKPEGEIGMYCQGILTGGIKTGFTSTWAGSLTNATIGALAAVPLSNVWKGNLAYAALGFGTALSAKQVADMYDDWSALAQNNFVVAGQSNAGEPAQNNQVYTHPTQKAWVYVSGSFLELDKGAVGTLSKSCWPLVATSFMAAKNKPVLFTACAEGSTSITQWQKPGTLYSRIITAKAALGWARCVLWQHGETDAGNGMPQEDYQTYLGQFIDDVYADTGWPVMISKLQTCSAYTSEQRDTINAAIIYVLANNPHALPGPDFSDYTTASVHFYTDAEIAVQANRWWSAIRSAFSW